MKRLLFKYVLPRLLMVISAVIIVMLAIELAMQIYFRAFGTLEQKVYYIYSSEQIQDSDLLFVPMPFVGYVPSPNQPDHNALGYRGPEVQIPKPAGVFRIAVSGGSTSYGDGLQESDTWARQLESILRHDYGYEQVEVVNLAAVGYSTWNTLVNFSLRGLELDPDLLIVYDSINDTFIRLRPPECYTALSPTRGLNSGGWREDLHLSRSALYRYLALRLGRMPNPSDLNAWVIPLDEFYPCEGHSLPPEEAYAANPPIYFERNLRSLVGVARAHDVKVVLSTWAFYPENPEAIPPE